MGMPDVWAFADKAFARIDVQGFRVRTSDGAVGNVVESIEAPGGGYLVVDPDVAMPAGRQLLVPAGLVEKIDLEGKSVSLGVKLEQVRNAPEFDSTRPLDEPSRSRFRDYFGSLTEGARKSRRRTTTSRRPASSGRARRASRSGDSGARTRTDAEPTKEQLYAEAKKLDIDGRSKMNKAQLARAVGRSHQTPSGRTRGAKANPVEVQAFLEDVGYPAEKAKLLRAAESQHANQDVRATLERLPNKRFSSPTEVSEAIGTLS